MESNVETNTATTAPTAKPKKQAKPKSAPKKGKGKASKTGGKGRARTGVGETIRAIILKKPDRPNKEIAEMAKAKHPDSNTNAACVAWYKNDMRAKKQIKK